MRYETIPEQVDAFQVSCCCTVSPLHTGQPLHANIGDWVIVVRDNPVAVMPDGVFRSKYRLVVDDDLVEKIRNVGESRPRHEINTEYRRLEIITKANDIFSPNVSACGGCR